MFEFIQLQMLRFKTLHAYRSGDWRKIPIKENGQPLLKIPNEISYPYYAKVMKLVKEESIYLREEVLDRVNQARARLMLQGFDLKVYDGWHSLQLQENLFWHYMREFTADKFGQKDQFDQLDDFNAIRDYFAGLPPDVQMVMREANRRFVSWPSKNLASPSPHTTGGAVDVWLVEEGAIANLGVPFDWMNDEAGAFYHLKFHRRRFSGEDQKVCRNRSRLILAMTKSGFSCYGPEFWHFNYGNQMDALVRGGTARYTYIEP